MEKEIEIIQKQLDKIMDNELVHLKADIEELHHGLSGIDIKVEKITVNVDWLMKFFWIIASASIGSLIAAILGLIIK